MFLALKLAATDVVAKECRFSDLIENVSAGKPFVASREGCENLVMLVNDRLIIETAGLLIDGQLANGKKMILRWDAGRIPAKYLEKTYRSDQERDYYLNTHATCSGDIYNPWALFDVRADQVTIQNVVLDKVPDGIHVSKGVGTVLRRLEFSSVCEDALTVRAARYQLDVDQTTIEESVFRGGDDKVINSESGKILIQQNTFIGSNKAVDSGTDDYYVPRKRGFVLLKGNTFENVKQPMRGSDKGHILSFANTFKGKSGTLYAGRTLGVVSAYQDKLMGSCEAMVFFSGNPRTVPSLTDSRSRDIPEYQGMARLKMSSNLHKELTKKCARSLHKKSDATKGWVDASYQESPWPEEWSRDFFLRAPDNSDELREPKSVKNPELKKF